MSKKTKAEKHARRVRSHKKRRPNRISPLEVPPGYMPKVDGGIAGMAFDQMLLQLLHASGIRDALLRAIVITGKPPKDEEPTIQ